MQLLIGNKNYSSWSLRPWLGLKVAGIDFEERLLPLRDEQGRLERQALSPSGKVPLLIDGELRIWDSLAIAEYLAESYPQQQLWPVAREARAVARAVCAEMHAGFAALRQECPLDVRARRPQPLSPAVTADVTADVTRILALWADCRARFGGAGPFLFGTFCWADAFYAPVALRFVTYGVALPPEAQAYVEALLALPALQEWMAAAAVEPWSHD